MNQLLLTIVLHFLPWAVLAAALASGAQAQSLEPLRAGGTGLGCRTRVVVLPAVGSAPTSVVLHSFQRAMKQAWNTQRTLQEKIIADRLKALRLRDIAVSLPPVPFTHTFTRSCSFSAIPATKLLRLTHQTKGNSVSARRSNLFGPDLVVSGTFELIVTMFFSTAGPPGEPLVLQRAEVSIFDFRFTGSKHPDARSLGQAFARQVFADAGVGAFVAVDANRFLRLLLGNQGVASVTPGARGGGDEIRLFLDVRLARPVAGVGVRN